MKKRKKNESKSSANKDKLIMNEETVELLNFVFFSYRQKLFINCNLPQAS